ncbi:sulfotransferase [Muricauda sp. 334s03]|uniref:Sulfotransferase n=1 Tax=Flagellimonas yonaguniensis TaxID=3031325 RepID=A0ABT5XUJ4_9FLAO|nr:sulfotransferase [[Muricauda] yonaguniensis]MDF0714771.1 sulfotransferase [[Muricauda] yonaguniensis]
MNLPNFLIVGAAKSGTTTLNYYLDKHSDVLMPTPKEPKYFSSKFAKYKGPGDIAFTKKRVISSLDSYKRLFNTSKEYKCMGDSSVDNLFYHTEVIPEIKSLLGAPKIIIVLRHPVDRAVSAYKHLIRDGREKMSIEQAIMMEEERLAKGFEFIWGYKKGGFYHDQVKSYMDNFPEVKVYLFEDLIQNTQEVLDQTCDFLGIPYIEAEENLKLNASGKAKWQFLNSLLIKDSFLRRMGTKMVGKNAAIKLQSRLQKINLSDIEISKEEKKSLSRLYTQDLYNLQELIDRDLSGWIDKY